jgi:aldose 1-epimerase
MSARVAELRNGTTTAHIATKGGSILTLSWDEAPLLRPAAPDALPAESACFPLVPFGNRIRGNRFAFDGREYTLAPNTLRDPHYLHGEGWRSDWTVTKHTANQLMLEHSHDGSSAPYEYNSEQSFRLLANGIELTLSVTNCGQRTMPYGIGWHPYFPLTPLTTLETRAGRMWSEEPGWLPGTPGPVPADLNFSRPATLPHRWVNNGFDEWSGRARLAWPERRLALTIDADPIFRVMFLFVSNASFDPSYRRESFALEPMSHMADGHNQPDLGGLVPLSPGETISGSMRLLAEATI